MLGFGSIGEFAIGEYSVIITHDVNIDVTLSNSIQPQVPEILRGAVIGVPSVSMAIAPAAPAFATGATIEPPVLDVVPTPQVIEIRRGAAIIGVTISLEQIAYAPPVLRGGISILWASESQIPNQTGGIGTGSIGEFAIGEGPISYVTAQRIPSPMVSPRTPTIASGAAVLPGVFNLDDLAYAPDFNARIRKLRSHGIAS
jgi:hypothetical protein